MNTTETDITVQHFVIAARRFCEWVEMPLKPGTGLDPYHTLQLLSLLYARALALPEVDAVQLHDFDRIPSLDAMALAPAREHLSTLPFQYYWEIPHALPLDGEEPFFGEIADDLGDVYQDVKEGLMTYQAGLEPLAVWHWRQTWRLHWGKHAVSAIKVLNEYVI